MERGGTVCARKNRKGGGYAKSTAADGVDWLGATNRLNATVRVVESENTGRIRKSESAAIIIDAVSTLPCLIACLA